MTAQSATQLRPRTISMLLSVIPYLGALAWVQRVIDRDTRAYISWFETLMYSLPLFWVAWLFMYAARNPEASSSPAVGLLSLGLSTELGLWPIRIMRTRSKNRILRQHAEIVDQGLPTIEEMLNTEDMNEKDLLQNISDVHDRLEKYPETLTRGQRRSLESAIPNLERSLLERLEKNVSDFISCGDAESLAEPQALLIVLAGIMPRIEGKLYKRPVEHSDLAARLAAEVFAAKIQAGLFWIPDALMNLQPGEKTYFSEDVEVLKLKKVIKTHRGYAGTRIKIGNLPIYLGGSTPFTTSRDKLESLGQATMVITDKRVVLMGSKVNYTIKQEGIENLEIFREGIQIFSSGRYGGRIYRISPYENVLKAAIALQISNPIVDAA